MLSKTTTKEKVRSKSFLKKKSSIFTFSYNVVDSIPEKDIRLGIDGAFDILFEEVVKGGII